jgi:predicted Mrr-cat superfamily restriction endonuclease
MSQQAFILRISPSGKNKVSEALKQDQIIIGWAKATGLLDNNLKREQFKEIIKKTYSVTVEASAGHMAGHMWCFIRKMKEGDLVIVPDGSDFYVAEINGPAIYDENKIDDDTAYRRPVKWLNDKKAIPRNLAKSALIARMRTQGTCTSATDLVEEIKECLQIASSGQAPTFINDLQRSLISSTLQELLKGRMDDRTFEKLIKTVLINLGAKEVQIVPRNKDKGADILATFYVAGAFRQLIAVQVKYYRPDPPADENVVEQLIKGIEFESANLGMVITSGTISSKAVSVAEKYFEETGIKIELVDGMQFAKLIVEHGIRIISMDENL